MRKQTLTRSEEIKPVIQLRCGRQLPLSHPLVMGILNVTPDSFSDGGLFDTNNTALEQAKKIEADGADIIDIGGESTRPGAEAVSEEEELARVIPIIEAIRRDSIIPISIDTYKANVAKEALEAGADMVNDISALRFDANMADVIADQKVPVILMHMLGEPRNMQTHPSYENCVEELLEFFTERIEYCISKGIDKSKLIIDPGIGFGKRLSDNLEIMSGLDKFEQFGLPILVGASRKSFIGMLHGSGKSADQRLGGSIAAATAAVMKGASIVRVHDVDQTVEALRVTQAIRNFR